MASTRRRKTEPSGLLPLIQGYWVAQLVYVAAELDLADLLAKAPQTPEALAKKVGADPVALARVLRALASLGVFKADAKGRFSASMASISAAENSAIASAYPFGELTRLVDVGGAHGHLLAAILRRHKKLRGVLYDQPQVVANAPARLRHGAGGAGPHRGGRRAMRHHPASVPRGDGAGRACAGGRLRDPAG